MTRLFYLFHKTDGGLIQRKLSYVVTTQLGLQSTGVVLVTLTTSNQSHKEELVHSDMISCQHAKFFRTEKKT